MITTEREMISGDNNNITYNAEPHILFESGINRNPYAMQF